jgi:DNA-binding winged helix-turn-helix (wHTH) protein/Tol biopolymer transport system component
MKVAAAARGTRTPGEARDAAPLLTCAEFGPFRLDRGTRELSRDGQVLALTPKAYDLLWVLVSNPQRVMEKEELMKLVWPDSFVSDDTLTQNVATLRRVLGDASERPQYIATVPRHGYRFVASVRSFPAHESVAAFPREASAQPLMAPAESARSSEEPPAPVTGIANPADSTPATSDAAGQTAPRRKVRWTLAGVLMGLAAVGVPSMYFARSTPANRSIRFLLQSPDDTTLMSAGYPSPDGRLIVFAAQDASGKALLYVRPVDSIDAKSLPGTEGASEPFWSPDGTAIGFFGDRAIKIIDLNSGSPPRTLATVSRSTFGASWNRNGIVLYGAGRTGLSAVPVSGGEPKAVTTLDPSAQEAAHMWPHFLPDGEHFLYGVRSASPDRRGVYIGSLNSNTRKRVLDPPVTAAVYASGHLFFVRDGTLMAQAFNVRNLTLEGIPEVIAPDVPQPTNRLYGMTFAAGNDGTVAYLKSAGRGQLVWFDRRGQKASSLETSVDVADIALSPDEQQLAATDRSDTADAGVWIFDLRRRVGSELASIGAGPIWSPDGSTTVYSSSQNAGILDVYQKRPLGNDRDELLLRTGKSISVHDWSSDGRYLVYSEAQAATRTDLWLLPLFGERRPVPYLQTPFDEQQAQVSPDARWLAYTSDETGTWEIYLRSFPVPGSKRRISTEGGGQARWRGDGKELFYLAPDRRLMSVSINAKRDGEIEIGLPEPLFQTPPHGDLVANRNDYVNTRDGQRFLVHALNERTSIAVVLNSTPGSYADPH